MIRGIAQENPIKKYPLRFSRFQVMASAGVFYDEQVSKSHGVSADHVYVKELAYTKKSYLSDMIILLNNTDLFLKNCPHCRDIQQKVKYSGSEAHLLRPNFPVSGFLRQAVFRINDRRVLIFLPH
jgi:hypothetical protein